jgi:hypothetical protein
MPGPNPGRELYGTSLDVQGNGQIMGNLTVTGTISGTLTGVVGDFVDGTVAAPAISFAAEPSSGLYRQGAGNVRMSILGVDSQQWNANGSSITGTLTLTADRAAMPLKVSGSLANSGAEAWASVNFGLISLGAGTWAGAAGDFAGFAGGTYLAINSPTGFAAGGSHGEYIRCTEAGSLKFSVSNTATMRLLGSANIWTTPPASALTGALALGRGQFTGAANDFSGAAAGTLLAMNLYSADSAADLVNMQVNGLSQFLVRQPGDAFFTGAIRPPRTRASSTSETGSSTSPEPPPTGSRATPTATPSPSMLGSDSPVA